MATMGRAFLLLGLSSLLLSAGAHADDQRANSLVGVFTQACLPNVGNPRAVRAWAAEKHLTPVTNPDGQRMFIGDGSDGAAWFFQVADVPAVLSIRSQTQACAIYGEAADPVVFREWFEMIVRSLTTTPGIKATTLREDDQIGQYGHRVGKVVLVAPFEHPPTGRIFTLITNERPGGAYQVTLQLLGWQPQQ